MSLRIGKRFSMNFLKTSYTSKCDFNKNALRLQSWNQFLTKVPQHECRGLLFEWKLWQSSVENFSEKSFDSFSSLQFLDGFKEFF